MQRPIFLTAAWRDLAMVNYAIDPEILTPHLPAGVELDFHDGKTFVSLVGFRFCDIRIKSFSIPWHRNFEEVNLRFYVRRIVGDEVRRCVCFLREIAPKIAVTTVANWVYRENYVTAPMKHEVRIEDETAEVAYRWRMHGRWNGLTMRSDSPWQEMLPGSEEEFIAEHYWGYSGSSTSGREYQVEHPRWKFRTASEVNVDCDIAAVYGDSFLETLSQPPSSAFIADGSAIQVRAADRVSKAS